MFKAEYLFVRIIFPFILGIMIFYFSTNKIGYCLLVACCLSIFCILWMLNILYKRGNIYQYKGYIGVLFFLFFFCFGGIICWLNKENYRSDYFGNQKFQVLKVYVNDEPQYKSGTLRFKARVTSCYINQHQTKASGQILIAIKTDSLNPVKLKYGNELLIGSKYTAIEPPYNQAEFNVKAWLASQNIYHQIYTSPNGISITQQNKGNFIIKYALSLREAQIKKYRSLIKNNEAFAVASTLILGYRADLSPETLSAYSKTGTIHALSVSGAHVGIIYFILGFLLLFLDRKKPLKFLKLILICGLIWVYALITGLSPSVVRSAIMITIFIFAQTYSKNKNGYNILAFSAFCQLLYNPFLIWDVGFQLSYLAVFGLIYLQPLIYNALYIKYKWADKIWQVIALSLAAQTVTFPLSIYYFHQFPVYFLLGNLLIMLPLTLMMYFGIAILIPCLNFLAPILEQIIILTNKMLYWISALPFSTLSSIWINLPELILLSLALGLMLAYIHLKTKRFLYLSLISFAIYQSCIAYGEIQLSRQEKIMFFALRKNYAVAFINGKEAIIETDLDLDSKSFGYFIRPYLDSLQIKKLVLLKNHQDTVLNTFIQKDNQIIFKKYKILLINEDYNYKKLTGNASFDAIWIQNSSKFNLEALKNQIKYRKIIIDASNKDYRIKQLKEYADNNEIEAHVLKKNNSYLVNLKDYNGRYSFIQGY